MAETVEVKVPDIGEFKNVEIIEIFVAEGDEVAENDNLISIESDKSVMDIPSDKSGKVSQLKVKEGDKVSEGDLLLLLEAGESSGDESDADDKADSSGSAEAAPEEPEEETSAESEKPAQKEASTEGKSDTKASAQSGNNSTTKTVVDQASFVAAHASPSVRKFARELGVDLSQVNGSGRNSRITKGDVQQFVKQAMQTGGATASAIPAQPDIDFSQFGEVERQSLSKIKRLTGEGMQRNMLLAPQVTQHDEADITELESFRKGQKADAEQRGVKLTMVSFLLAACAKALKEFPEFNASLSADGTELILKRYVNIGVAVDTPAGLLVPVIRDADSKGLYQLGSDLTELAGKARDRKLKPNEMQGSCFSISSLGGIGGTGFTPIVNVPEVAILGVCKAQTKPLWNGTEFEPRLMMPLSLSYDHRVIDGVAAAKFTRYIADLLSDFRRVLL